MAPRFPPLLLTTMLLAALAGGCPQLADAANARYDIDPVHTRVAFLVSHAGFSRAIGTFSGSHGELEFDPDDWSTAKVDVTVPIATLDLGDDKWREKILDATFFNAEKYRDAHFVATRIEKTGEATAKVTGDLTLRGVTRPVTLDATLNALQRHPLTLRRTVGFSATAELSRKDFGMDAWESVVADKVQLIIEVEASRARSGGADTDKEPEHADPQSR
jgi:polyisoprenoid-binding protein YceI